MFSKSPIKRIGRNRFMRNVLIALGNSKSRNSLPYIKRNLNDDSPIVRGAAIWAIHQILKDKEFKIRKELQDCKIQKEFLNSIVDDIRSDDD